MLIAPPKTQRSRRTIYLDAHTVGVLKSIGAVNARSS
jgi:hypothetical protein